MVIDHNKMPKQYEDALDTVLEDAAEASNTELDDEAAKESKIISSALIYSVQR